jgi:3-hydroxymyristoyl/3-hydroxydecanoyl-(acyl carrier protein) dehydratase
MRWHFVDKIVSFKSWNEIAGLKAVSLEEYNLLERFGRKGEFPASLVLESCVELLRWLVSKSSDFTQTCALSGLEKFAFYQTVGAGDLLSISAAVIQRDENVLYAECRVTCGEEKIAEGNLSLTILPFSEFFDRETAESVWKEIYAAP